MNKVISWLFILSVGIYALFNEKVFYSKFHTQYPENLYIGGIMIIVASIGLIIHFRKK